MRTYFGIFSAGSGIVEDFARKWTCLGRPEIALSHSQVDCRMPSATTPKDVNAIVLAGLRVAVGLLFLLFGEYKVFGTQFRLGGGFQSWIHQFLASGTYPFMVPVLRDFVLVHGAAIAFLVAYGEWRLVWHLFRECWCAPRVYVGWFICSYYYSRRTIREKTQRFGNISVPRWIIWSWRSAFVAFALGDVDQFLSLRRRSGHERSSLQY